MQPIKINIPQPCSENWSEMTTTEKGKFCASCKKDLIDFSLLSDHQILNIIANNDGSTCGRFRRDQLNRTLIPIEEKDSPKFLRYAASLLLTMAAGNMNALMAHQVIEVVESSETSEIKTSNLLLKAPYIIAGIVRDATTFEPIDSCQIKISGEAEGVFSDKEGKFMFEIPEKYRANNVVIEITYFDLEVKQMVLEQADLEGKCTNLVIDYLPRPSLQEAVIEVEPIQLVSIGVIVVERQPFHKRLFWKVKRIFSRTF